MALATRTDTPADTRPKPGTGKGPGGRPGKRPSLVRTLWDSTIGKKTVMAVSGLMMLLFLVAHMIGNLKIFFGPGEFNHYARWLRTIGEPAMHYEWTLWVLRAGLVL